jgi:serine/threonine protein kinase
MPNSAGLPVLSDFGEARIDKGSNRGDIMPGIYRAPEVILDMEWDCKVDVWSIGTMVSLPIISYMKSCFEWIL